MIDLNHRPSLTESMTALIDAALCREVDGYKPRYHIGPSALGESCERKIQYGYTHTPKDAGRVYGQNLRIAKAGHYGERETIKELRLAGFTIADRKKDGSGQIGFSVADGKFQGHCDGVFVAGPDFLKYPSLLEHKNLGNKSFNLIIKHGVSKAKPEYAAQIALYQVYLDLTENPAVFIARNRDTLEFYFELIPFNPELAQKMSDRAVRIIHATDAGELLPRVTKNSDHFECKFCAWQERCWRQA